MKAHLEEKLGADRVLEPSGFLPQPALRLDPSGPVRPFEFEVDVDRLCLDSTSFRNIRERCDADTDAMSARVMEIVASARQDAQPRD